MQSPFELAVRVILDEPSIMHDGRHYIDRTLDHLTFYDIISCWLVTIGFGVKYTMNSPRESSSKRGARHSTQYWISNEIWMCCLCSNVAWSCVCLIGGSSPKLDTTTAWVQDHAHVIEIRR